MEDKERWQEIEGFPGYEVSTKGRIRGFRNYHGQITDNYTIIKPRINKDGYYELTLYTKEHKKVTKRVHRVVCETFLGKHLNLVVNHIDGNKLNNHIENLEFVTAEQNSTLAAEMGLYKTKPIKIVETGEVFSSIKKCADAIKVHPANISGAMAGKNNGKVNDLHFEFIDEEFTRPSFLRDYQYDAVKRMKTGCILNGGVGSGKSRTSLYYYFTRFDGQKEPYYKPMIDPPDLYIITTAMKRDKCEWEGELAPFLLSTNPEVNCHENKVVVDSWNNIKKYSEVTGAFFIFDEDRVTGSGAWVKAFLKIAKNNEWIILSASPGDQWIDYVPVMIANGFYRNRTEFNQEHVIYKRFSKFPQIDGYMNTGRLMRLRNSILVDMDFERHTVEHHEDVYVDYDRKTYKEVGKTRWDIFKDEPIENAAGLCYIWRKIVNSDPSRVQALLDIFKKHQKLIIFYSFDYERDILLELFKSMNVEITEWSGHAHEAIPQGDSWVYLVNYASGAEGWNATTTDTMVFFSQTYSYKTLLQASGRINRLNTPYIDLYYYHIKSRSPIDLAINKALKEKKKFNETRFVSKL